MPVSWLACTAPPSIAPFGIETRQSSNTLVRYWLLQSHLLVLKLWNPAPPAFCAFSFNRTFWYWNLLFLKTFIVPFFPSIAPFGIETYTKLTHFYTFRILQSHLLVLKPIKVLFETGIFISFNRTFWYWNFLWARHQKPAKRNLQSHLLVLKLKMLGFQQSGSWNLQSHLLVLKHYIQELSTYVETTFNRTFWYWNLPIFYHPPLTSTLQSHLLVLKPWNLQCRMAAIISFNRTFWYWNLLNEPCPIKKRIPFNRTFWYWNYQFE